MDKISAAKLMWPHRPVVLVGWKGARFLRGVAENEAVRRFLKQWRDATWHTYEGVENPHSATDTLVSTVVAGGNQFYADSVREAILRAHEERLHARTPVTGWPGFGHRRDGDHWRVDPIKATLLREAIDDVLEGVPMAAVVRRRSEARSTSGDIRARATSSVTLGVTGRTSRASRRKCSGRGRSEACDYPAIRRRVSCQLLRWRW